MVEYSHGSVHVGLSFVVGLHDEYYQHDIINTILNFVACYGIVMYLLTTCVVVFKVNANDAAEQMADLTARCRPRRMLHPLMSLPPMPPPWLASRR